MTTSLIPNFYKYNSAVNFVNSLSQPGSNNNYYYVFAGNHLPYENSTIPTIYDNVSNTVTDVYRNMIFGKLVQPTDASLMIRRVDYQSSTVYSIYDDQDRTLADKNFFVVTNDVGYYNVFKCLNNNNGGLSTVPPSITSVGTDGIFYSVLDGYTWKYMYSIDNTSFDKFATSDYIPFVANNDVINSAINGQINSIKIVAPGSGYSNYILSATFQASDVKAFSNPLYYKISTADASNQYDFYKGCILYIKSGTGVGQYRTIQSYVVQNTTKYVILDSAFTTQPDNTSTYTISPRVYINGDQTETSNTIAYAEIDAAQSNGVSNIVILDPGKDYKIASANVYASEYVGVTVDAVVRPIISPPGGHGANPANELFCSRAAFSVKFTTSESNTVPVVGNFRQIGVLANPLFSSVTVEYTTSRGTFEAEEDVVSFYPRRIQSDVTIGVGSNIMTTTDVTANFYQQFNIGDKVYVSDDINDYIFTVNGINSATELSVAELSAYDFSGASAYLADVIATGTAGTVLAGFLTVVNLSKHIKDDSYVIGVKSGGIITAIDAITINDKQKQFDTFVGSYRYQGAVTSGTFINNEMLIQSLAEVSNAYLQSVQTDGGISTFYVTNQNGIFNTSDTITGVSSGAVATLTTKYLPEIVFGSGTILYLENLEPITRTTGQSEIFKLIFEF